MTFHGNSKQNTNPHHLYEIRDKELDDIFKYGISAEPFGKDGLSKRVRRQVVFLNLVAGWSRYSGFILLKNISDRVEAERLEDEFIDNYTIENGKRPRGNPPRKKKS